MQYELRLSAPNFDVLPLVAIADAVARAAATAGDTPFHKPTHQGKFRKLLEWVVGDAREGKLVVTDQDGRPGTFDEVIQRANSDGTYSEVLSGPSSTDVDLNMTHALCIYTTLSSLNKWARERGDEFSISRVGWIDERGWIEPNDVATENRPTTDSVLTVSGERKTRPKPVHLGAINTSVVVFICGREAIPVRAIPLVTGRWMSPDVVAKSLAHADSMNRFEGVYAYQLLADGGYSQVLPSEWDVVDDQLEGLASRLNAMSDDKKLTRPIWLAESTRLLHVGVFLWRDEFEREFRRCYSPTRFTVLHARPGDLTLKFSPLIAPPETREIIMEGFEGLPLAAITPPVVGEKPETRMYEENDVSAWDELEPASYHEHMGLAVFASLYPTGKRAGNASDERCIELAGAPCLQAADWIELSGVGLGKYTHYYVEESGIRFVKWDEQALISAPRGWQPPMLRDNDTPPLLFPCTPCQLLLFVDTLRAGVNAFSVPDAFRRAVAAMAQKTNTKPQVPSEPQEQSDTAHSGAAEKAMPEVTPAAAKTEAPSQLHGLGKREILCVDWPLVGKFKQDSLARAMSDVPKWLIDAQVCKGAPGRASALWNPAVLADCLREKGYASRGALCSFLKKHFPECLPEFKTRQDFE
ncbi:MAG: hypothetical protein DVS81_15940 [Candidatus Accumulibacter meliphilus]|jgi:hypothetical protein|uniref:Uncharacterized protein n=1 Tax=Candidatus Accumulibacter meliphilus TaxID=2211374 RepID=A0A369XHH9_9PROT|nr:MAG: hypothetical protein DVS81_15940 [Candidatus Accumulibacter meliphilus]